MASPSRQLEAASVHEQALEVCRELLAELGNPRGLQAVRGDAHLDRDLGLGSLERVELMLRLDSAFGVHLADQVVAEADTLQDLIAAVSAALLNAGAAPPSSVRVETSSCGEPRTGPPRTMEPPVGVGGAPKDAAAAAAADADLKGVEAAATLQEVLRYRARVDASRPHLYFPDDTSPGLGPHGARGAARQELSRAPVTFGQLYARAAAVAAELTRRGIAPGHTVAIMLPTSPEFFYTFAGVLLAGAIPVPISPPFRADRVAEYASRQSAILSNA